MLVSYLWNINILFEILLQGIFRNSEVVQKAVNRILDIFEERQIYSKSQLADMRNAQSSFPFYFKFY